MKLRTEIWRKTYTLLPCFLEILPWLLLMPLQAWTRLLSVSFFWAVDCKKSTLGDVSPDKSRLFLLENVACAKCWRQPHQNSRFFSANQKENQNQTITWLTRASPCSWHASHVFLWILVGSFVMQNQFSIYQNNLKQIRASTSRHVYLEPGPKTTRNKSH